MKCFRANDSYAVAKVIRHGDSISPSEALAVAQAVNNVIQGNAKTSQRRLVNLLLGVSILLAHVIFCGLSIESKELGLFESINPFNRPWLTVIDGLAAVILVLLLCLVRVADDAAEAVAR